MISAGFVPNSWQNWAAAMVVVGAIGGGVWRVVRAGRRIGHHVDQILHKVEGMDAVKEAANEATLQSKRATLAATEARDEWRGATRTIRDMADGHGALLRAHGIRLEDHEQRIRRLEDDKP